MESQYEPPNHTQGEHDDASDENSSDEDGTPDEDDVVADSLQHQQEVGSVQAETPTDLSVSSEDEADAMPPSIISPQELQSMTPLQLKELQAQNERRSSARNVKRKKFADEIVEASLRPAYYRNRSDRPKDSSAHQQVSSPRSLVVNNSHLKKNLPGSKSALAAKRSRANRAPGGSQGGSGYQEAQDEDLFRGLEAWWDRDSNDPEDLSYPGDQGLDLKRLKIKKKKGSPSDEPEKGRKTWTSMDDLKLITALQQLCDFDLVAKYVSFSTKTDSAALQHRWTELLDDSEACSESVEGMDRIPLDTIQRIRKMKFFTDTEEEAIKSIMPGQATVEEFEHVLEDYNHLFFPGRNPEDLLSTWKYVSQRVKTELGKPPPDTNPELPSDLNLLRIRHRIADIQSRASCFGQALITLTNHLNYRSKHVGCEVAYLKALSERIASNSLPDQQRPKFQRDHKSTLAFLSGVCVDYAIVNEEATFGYSHENATVDIDLSLEGNIVNLLPLQGAIFLDIEGNFHIENYNGSSISVNGFTLSPGDDAELPDNAAVDIGTLTFQFYTNPVAIKKHVELLVSNFVNRAPTVQVNQNHTSSPREELETESEEADENGNEEDGSDDSDNSDEDHRVFYIDETDAVDNLFSDELMEEEVMGVDGL